jgi:DNA replication licensing factor MCM4
VLPAQTMREYIAYARTRCQPRITDDAAAFLARQYQIMRTMGRERNSIIVTPRQLESVIRLSESLARMRLARAVTVEHAREAVQLWRAAFTSSARNRQGDIDLDTINTGVSASDRRALAAYSNGLMQVLDVLFSKTPLSGIHISDYIKGIHAVLRAGQPRDMKELPPLHLVNESGLRAALAGMSDKYVIEASGMIKPARLG